MYKQEMSSIVDGKIIVDWSHAPSDAHLYTPETDDNYEGFLKIVGNDAYCFVPSIGMTGWRLEGVRTNEQILNDESMIKKEIV